MRSSSAGSRLQTVLPCAETAAMLFWALLASGQITMRKVQRSATPSPRNQTIRSLTSPHDRIASCRPKMRQSIPTQVATGPRQYVSNYLTTDTNETVWHCSTTLMAPRHP